MLFIPLKRAGSLFAAIFLAFSLLVPAAYAHEGGEAKPEDSNKAMYVDFKNIVVPVIKKNGKTGVLAMAIMAEVPDVKAQSKITNQLPKLRDAFIRALYGNLDDNKYVREDGALDIEHIKDRLMKTAAYVMRDDKEGQIKDILFQNISQIGY